MDRCTENVIEFLENANVATVSFSQGRYKSRIRKLAIEKPDMCEIIAENADGSLCAHIPVSWIKIKPPKEFTSEQRAKMGERLHRNV
ncbi:MAG: hypothetical protein LUC94_13085 [Clostridiales bacterium]|nr:hypothetical protein [Clostridiales bacterium]